MNINPHSLDLRKQHGSLQFPQLLTPNAPAPPQQQQQTNQDSRQIQSPQLPKDLPQSPSLTNAENASSSAESGPLYPMAPPRVLVFNDLPQLRSHIQSHAQNHGFAIATHKSDSKKIIIICDRGGNYKDPFADKEEQRKRKRTSKKLGCPYRVTGRKWASDGMWHVTITNPSHNHPPAEELAKARNLSRLEEIYTAMKEKFPRLSVEKQLAVLERVEAISNEPTGSPQPQNLLPSVPPLLTEQLSSQQPDQPQTPQQQQPQQHQHHHQQQQQQSQQSQQQQQHQTQHQQHQQQQLHTQSQQSQQQQQQQQPSSLQEQTALGGYQQHQPPSSQPPHSQPQQPQTRQPQQLHQPQPQHLTQSYFYGHPSMNINTGVLPSHTTHHPHQQPPTRLLEPCNRCGGDHHRRNCPHHPDPGRAAVELLEDHENAVQQAFIGTQHHHLRQAHPHNQQPPGMHRGYSTQSPMQSSNGVGGMSLGPPRNHPQRLEEIEAENKLREVFGVPVIHS